MRVDLILGDCVLHEVHKDPGGLEGESYSVYDASRKVWHQTWVTNRGQLLEVEGGKRGDAIVLEGSAIDAKGVDTLYRVLWKLEGKDVRETAETPTDAGKNWKPWFDLRFKRHKP